jgi:ribonuclease HI
MASIFCDGACSGNGTRHAYGGWAWAFWPGAANGEPMYYGAGKLKTTANGSIVASTNQRAELTALLEAIKWAAAHPQLNLTIYTDSMYSLNCTTKWGPGWRKKGWKRDSGEPLQNLDLIKQLVELWRPCWPLQHVRGHQTGSGPEVHGNNWVDRAAVAAARGEEITAKVFALDIPASPALSLTHSNSGFNLAADNVIEHVVEKPTVKPLRPAPKAADVKQADIRNWFGGA